MSCVAVPCTTVRKNFHFFQDLQVPILHGNMVMIDEARNFFQHLPNLTHIWFDQLREGRIFVHRVYSRLDYMSNFDRRR